MTDTEKKALALLNEVTPYECVNTSDACHNHLIQALCRAIEAHDAFRQEVSDALREWGVVEDGMKLSRFIITKPDPLEEVLAEKFGYASPVRADQLRAALTARGLKIVEVSHD